MSVMMVTMIHPLLRAWSCVISSVIYEIYIFRVLVRHARKIAQQYYLMYKEQIPASQLVQRLASVMQEYTQSGWVF